MRARRAALGAALRALRSNVTAEGAGEGSAGRPAAQFRPLSVAGAVGVASQGSGGVILCLSWSDIEAQGAAEALSLYQAPRSALHASHSRRARHLALSLSQAVALLRQRCHGSATSFANDDKGLRVEGRCAAADAADIHSPSCKSCGRSLRAFLHRATLSRRPTQARHPPVLGRRGGRRASEEPGGRRPAHGDLSGALP